MAVVVAGAWWLGDERSPDAPQMRLEVVITERQLYEYVWFDDVLGTPSEMRQVDLPNPVPLTNAP